MDWEHVRVEDEDNNYWPYYQWLLKVGDRLIVVQWEGDGPIGKVAGRFYVLVEHGSRSEKIGEAAELDEAKQLAIGWMLQHIVGMLKAIGADGAWLLRGANYAALTFDYLGHGPIDEPPALKLEPPHELILLAKFAAGDGGEPGIESL